MTWRDDLRRVTLPDGRRLIGASFRGVPFFVESAERSGGRRVVTHEFPLRDDPFVEDLGRRARVFQVQGYVIGDDYVLRRDEIIAVLEDTAGPGELVHPYHGVRRAICSGLSVREAIADGGMALLAIEFTEAPVQSVTPSEQPDLIPLVGDSAAAAATATQTEFEDGYLVAGLPAFALESASAALTTATEAVGAALSPVVRVTQELAQLDAKVHLIQAQASSLVRQPAAVLDAFTFAFTSLAETTLSAPGDVMRALLDAYAVDLGPAVPETTATRQRERANQLALTSALRRLMAIEAARLAPQVDYESIEEATAARDAVAAALEEQAATAGDTAYPALIQLRADVMRAVPSETTFARLLTVTRRVAIPSLLLSYQLYGSVDEEPDILARNRVRHPGFIAGDLSVLSSVDE
jgi:prophage DNA circulation protein